MRDASHLARQLDALEWQLVRVMAAAARQWGNWEDGPDELGSTERLVRETDGGAELWRAGGRPAEVI